ncbi:MAG TPA: amidohydrolase family protein [Trueperaceae bacterium]
MSLSVGHNRSQPGPPNAFAITGLTAVVGEEMEVREGLTLVVEGGRIARLDAGPPPGDVTVVDGSRLIATPGFVNAHTHIADIAGKEAGFGLDSWRVVMPPDGVKVRLLAEARDEAVVDAIRDAAHVMLASGTTTFADFREGGAHGLDLLEDALAGLPLRSVAFARHAAHPPHAPEDLEANRGGLSRELKAELERLLDRAPGWSVPLAFDVTDQGLRDTAELVRARGKLLATHCVETDRYRTISRRRFGESDVERVVAHLRPDHIVHMTSGTDEEFELVAAAGIPVVVAPRMQSVMGIGLPPVDRMVAAGLTVALGSDNGMLASPDLLREMEYLSRATRAARHDPTFPSPAQLLQMATINGAKALGLASELGSLSVGKRADVVLFDAESRNLRPVRDPLATVVNRAVAADIACVLVDGVPAVGALPGLDVSAAGRRRVGSGGRG